MVILSGEDEQTLYQFGTKVARYTFCPRCGCNAFHRSRGNQYRYSVNARCLADFDELLANNEIWFVNGRDHPFDRHSEEIETLPMPIGHTLASCQAGLSKSSTNAERLLAARAAPDPFGGCRHVEMCQRTFSKRKIGKGSNRAHRTEWNAEYKSRHQQCFLEPWQFTTKIGYMHHHSTR